MLRVREQDLIKIRLIYKLKEKINKLIKREIKHKEESLG